MFAPDFVYRISLPQKIKSSFYVPDENEIKVIYKLIKNTELEIPFLLASQCGLRPLEICALTKDCITADGLEIRKAVVINEHGREVYKPPKSYAGYRTIPISPLLRDKLMNTPDKKRICVISSNKISRDWNSFLRKHGLHIFRFYSLRHYYASQALLLGIPQKYIAELMGHSSTDMIEKVYQHIFPSAMEEFKVRIADNIENFWGNKGSNPSWRANRFDYQSGFSLHIIYRKGGTVFMLFRLILFRFNKFRYPLDPPEHRKMNSRVRQHKYRTLRFT
ncbi:MAG: site-specific integrase [[Eubacterium] siraeum]